MVLPSLKVFAYVIASQLPNQLIHPRDEFGTNPQTFLEFVNVHLFLILKLAHFEHLFVFVMSN